MREARPKITFVTKRCKNNDISDVKRKFTITREERIVDGMGHPGTLGRKFARRVVQAMVKRLRGWSTLDCKAERLIRDLAKERSPRETSKWTNGSGTDFPSHITTRVISQAAIMSEFTSQTSVTLQSATPSTATNNLDSAVDGLSKKAIVGIIIAIAIVLILGCLAVSMLLWRHRRGRLRDERQHAMKQMTIVDVKPQDTGSSVYSTSSAGKTPEGFDSDPLEFGSPELSDSEKYAQYVMNPSRFSVAHRDSLVPRSRDGICMLPLGR